MNKPLQPPPTVLEKSEGAAVRCREYSSTGKSQAHWETSKRSRYWFCRNSNNIEVLYVVGSRESKEPGVYEWTPFQSGGSGAGSAETAETVDTASVRVGWGRVEWGTGK